MYDLSSGARLLAYTERQQQISSEYFKQSNITKNTQHINHPWMCLPIASYQQITTIYQLSLHPNCVLYQCSGQLLFTKLYGLHSYMFVRNSIQRLVRSSEDCYHSLKHCAKMHCVLHCVLTTDPGQPVSILGMELHGISNGSILPDMLA